MKSKLLAGILALVTALVVIAVIGFTSAHVSEAVKYAPDRPRFGWWFPTLISLVPVVTFRLVYSAFIGKKPSDGPKDGHAKQ